MACFLIQQGARVDTEAKVAIADGATRWPALTLPAPQVPEGASPLRLAPFHMQSRLRHVRAQPARPPRKLQAP